MTGGGGFRLLSRPGKFLLLEQNQEVSFVASWSVERDDLEPDDGSLILILYAHHFFRRGDLGLAGFINQNAKFIEQSRPCHLEKIEAGLSGGKFEVTAGSSAALQNLEFVVYHYGGGNVLGQQQAIRFTLNVCGRLNDLVLFLFASPVRFFRTSGSRLMGTNCEAKRDGGRNGLFLIDLSSAVDEIEDLCA